MKLNKRDRALIHEAFNAGKGQRWANAEDWLNSPSLTFGVNTEEQLGIDNLFVESYEIARLKKELDQWSAKQEMSTSKRELFEKVYGDGMPVGERERLFQRDENGYKLMQCREAYKWFCEGMEALKTHAARIDAEFNNRGG